MPDRPKDLFEYDRRNHVLDFDPEGIDVFKDLFREMYNDLLALLRRIAPLFFFG